MTDDVVARAREALEGITPGPWVADPHEDDDYDKFTVGAGEYLTSPGCYRSTDCIHEVDTYGYDLDEKDYRQIKADGEFIAAAPELVADLLAEVERLRAQINACGPCCSHVMPEEGSDD